MNKEQESIVEKYNSFISSVSNFPFCSKNMWRTAANKRLGDLFREGKEIFVLDGELDPRIYSEVIECIPTDCQLNIICGPYVAVEDKEFLKYYDVNNNNINNWWYSKRKANWSDIHPFFKNRTSGPGIKIFILKFRIFDNWNFCIEKKSGLIYAEKQNEELERSETNFFLTSNHLAEKGIELWNGIFENFIKEIWDKEKDKDLPYNLLFKPFSIFEREKTGMKQLIKWIRKNTITAI